MTVKKGQLKNHCDTLIHNILLPFFNCTDEVQEKNEERERDVKTKERERAEDRKTKMQRDDAGAMRDAMLARTMQMCTIVEVDEADDDDDGARS